MPYWVEPKTNCKGRRAPMTLPSTAFVDKLSTQLDDIQLQTDIRRT